MSAYTPDSTVKFYQVDIDTNAGRTRVFNNAAAREHWFSLEGRTVASEVNCQVVKKRFQTIKTSIALATIQNCNYLSFINPSYGNKIFYCHIQSLDYVNNNTTLVSYSVDWWLTDMFNVVYDGCMVTREGLTNAEYTDLSKNPYIDNLKMRTEEPLGCDSDTEPLRYKIAGTNCFSSPIVSGWKSNDGWNAFAQHETVYKDANGKYMWDSSTAADTSIPDESPFYVLSFAGSIDSETGVELVNDCFTDMRDYANQTGNPAYLMVTPELFNITGGPSMTYYAEARHADGASLSTSNVPIHDTKQARPYYMLGCKDLPTMKKVIDNFNNRDAVSAILSIFAFPTYLLDEFIVGSFAQPASSLIALNSVYLRIPFPTVSKEVRVGSGDVAYAGSAEISPKLFRFPYSYVTLEGINDSGHIELQYEKMGKFDPMLTESYNDYATGVRVDSNGKPTYFVFQKWVSIQADGIYIGISPVDYDKRVDCNTSGTSAYYIAKSDLAHGVFYTDFPQVPFTTDAYYSWLASQARQMTMAQTELNRMSQERQYGELAASRMTTAVGGATGLLSNAAGLLGSSAPKAGAAGAAGAGVSTGLGILNSGMSASEAYLSASNQMANMEQERMINNGAAEYLSNPQVANEFTRNFAGTKSAFVSPNYHQGSNGGALNLLAYVEPIGVNVLMRRRAEPFINAYNEFFKNYGYATNMYKEPSIKYITNNNDTASEAPHLENASSGGSAKWGQFYTQTENLRVHGVCGESASFIENLYNGGCLFSAFIYTPA